MLQLMLDKYKNKEIPEYLPKNIFMIDGIDYKIDMRSAIINKVGYVLLSNNWIRLLASYLKNRKCIEILSGCGSLSYVLQQKNIDIIATDDYSWNKHWDSAWTTIEEIDAENAIIKYGKDIDYVICSWPNYESEVAYNSLIKMREVNSNLKMIYSLEIVDNLDDINSVYPTWFGMNDFIMVVK
jgi:hypothetical protein